MPASSRKRNKGKDRKAKQLAKKEENERAEAHELWNSWVTGAECDHGCDVISDDHPVSSFIDQIFINLQHNRNIESFDLVVSETLKELIKSHRHIWNSEDYRRLANSVLIQIGTNLLLREGSYGPLCFAHCIVILEHYDGSNSIGSSWNHIGSVSKLINLQQDISSTCRDVLKFYRKRTSCKCLKKMHLEARKSTPKMGICYGCNEEMERVLLSVCSRCMVTQYCSRQCQVANWDKHRDDCGLIHP